MDDLKEKGSINITGHLLIRDKNTGQVVLNKSLNTPIPRKKFIANVEKKDE